MRLPDVFARGRFLPRVLNLSYFRSSNRPVRFSPVIFCFFFVVSLAVNYPGRLSVDSIEQLIGAYDVQYLNDWHSPLVTWLWSLAGALGQPVGALLIQSLPLAFYAAVRPQGSADRTWQAYLGYALEFILKASLIALAGTIIKDTLLVGLLLASVAALQLALSNPQARRWMILFVGCLAVVAMVRPVNFILLLVPALVFAFLYAKSRRVFFLSALVVSFCLLLFMPAYGVSTRLIFGAHPLRPEKQLILFDVAAVSALTGKNLFRSIDGWPADQLPSPQACYTPDMWDPMAPWGACRGYSQAYGRSFGRRALPWAGVWGSAIVSHPGAYLTHRSRHLYGSLWSGLGRFGERSSWGIKDAHLALNSAERASELRAYSAGRIPDGYFLKAEHSLALRPFSRISWVALGVRGMPLLAVLVCLGLLALQLRRHVRGAAVDPVVVFVTALGLGNVLLVAGFGVATSARYLLPVILCGYVALLTILQNHAFAQDKDAQTQVPAGTG